MKCDAAKLLSELLARIHRDGGHYEDEVGTEKAVQDADAKIVGWLAADSAKPAGEPSIPTNARISAIAARHFTNWPKFPDEVFSFARELIESLASPATKPEPAGEAWKNGLSAEQIATVEAMHAKLKPSPMDVPASAPSEGDA